MPEHDKTDADNQPKSGEDQKGSQRGLWLIIAAGFIAVVAVIFVGSFWISPVDRTRFITEFILTVALADLVAVQAYIYKKQWAAMKGQLEAMQEQLTLMREQTGAIKAQAEASEISAKASETSAVAAKQTAEVALKSFITAERPEIYFKRTQLYPLERGKQARAIFLACNGGRITAYKVAIEFNYCAPPRAIFALDKVLPWDDAILDRIDVLPPEADMTVRPTFGFEPTEVDLIGLGNGVLSLYIYGRMRYEDGYGREYTMSFYRQYNPHEPLELTYAPESVKTKADHEAEKHRRGEQARSPDSGT
jgi:hypothetical protein